jgi:hypothetical protein
MICIPAQSEQQTGLSFSLQLICTENIVYTALNSCNVNGGCGLDYPSNAACVLRVMVIALYDLCSP